MTALRTFVAVPLPETLRAELLATATALAVELPGVKWTRKIENLHVTIKFLGKVAEDRLSEVGSALVRAVSGLPRFEAEVRGLGAFPSARRASVIWAGIEARGGELGRIAEAVEAMAAGLGVGEREDRPFRGHITVGRAPKRDDVDARAVLAPLADRSFGRVAVEELHLYESQLGHGPDNAGSTYVLRQTAALASN